MQRAQNHKIHTASFQVQFEGVEEALGLQDDLGLLFVEKIQPLLEKAFEQSSKPNMTIVMDKLVLDCGRIQGKNWENELLRSLSIQLDRELQINRSNPRLEKSIDEQAMEVLLFFLDKGYFPWNSPFLSPSELEKSLNLTGSQASKLAAFLRKSSVFRTRFHRSFSTSFQLEFLDQLVKNPHHETKQFLEHIGKRASLDPPFFHSVFEVFLQEPIALNSSLDHIFIRMIDSLAVSQLQILAEFLAAHWVSKREKMEELFQAIKQDIDPRTMEKVRTLIAHILVIQPALADDFRKAIERLQSQSKNHEGPSHIQRDTLEDDTASERVKASDTVPTAGFLPEEMNLMDGDADIFVANAGLVLLHPFISGLLDTLGLQTNGNFNDPEAQLAATKVLQFLVWGENTLSENHFPLIKILLGIPLSQVLDLGFDLPEAWKTECEAMLSEVIQHWSVLKNTSIAGLRETFLQREGKVSPTLNGWKLQVERKTVDVLLGKLPWGIGIVKLPWMNEIMYVDWN